MKITFEHSGTFDEYIAGLRGAVLDESMAAKIDPFLSRLNDHWKKVGACLLTTACEVSGFDFKLSETRCTVTVGDFVSMSHPFIVNISKHLNSPDLDEVEEIIFHESLHILLTDNWKVWPTELVKKHGRSNSEIEAHLHLMSLEFAVHQRLGNFERLNWIGSWYERIGGGYFAAWNTIKSDDRYREFVHELKDSTQWQAKTILPSSTEKTLAFQ